MNKDVKALLNQNYCRINGQINYYQGSRCIESNNIEHNQDDEELNFNDFNKLIDYNQAKWQIRQKVKRIQPKEVSNQDMQILEYHHYFEVISGESLETTVGVQLEFEQWNIENYVFMPAAVYQGNRFISMKMDYPPMLQEEQHVLVGHKEIITDVPRLNMKKGISKIQQLTRDLSTPALGFYSEEKKKGFLFLTEQNTQFGDSGISITENEERNKAIVKFTCPGIREEERYTMCNSSYPSEDRGVNLTTGNVVDFKFRVYFFECLDLQQFFETFFIIRKDFNQPQIRINELPFSEGWRIQEEKYNKENWIEKYGYYAIGARENKYEDWQIGWVGGLMSTLPLLYEGQDITRQRVLRTYDFALINGQDKSGLYLSCFSEGNWFGDNFTNIDLKWHLIRKSADTLYFVVKQWMLIEKLGKPYRIKDQWHTSIKQCANAFIRLWEQYGEFGQFADSETGYLYIKGSSSAAIASAGLALLSTYYDNARYLEVAIEAANYYYEKFLVRGIMNGGPGEICQCSDSESAFGLLESFIILYDVTLDLQWIEKAKFAAALCATWCVSYDFVFPPETTFGKLGIHTLGSVYANIQNKHSAPGICTLSGHSLFKLYRATKDLKYLELIQDIAHGLPQYLSRQDKPIMSLNGLNLPSGWMNERVEMSDWWEPIGEVCYSSTWPEISNMLTYIEIPGIYVQTDTGFICVFDHIEAQVAEVDELGIQLSIYNPTQFDAKIKIFIEESSDMRKPLDVNYLYNCLEVFVQCKTTNIYTIKK